MRDETVQVQSGHRWRLWFRTWVAPDLNELALFWVIATGEFEKSPTTFRGAKRNARDTRETVALTQAPGDAHPTSRRPRVAVLRAASVGDAYSTSRRTLPAL